MTTDASFQLALLNHLLRLLIHLTLLTDTFKREQYSHQLI